MPQPGSLRGAIDLSPLVNRGRPGPAPQSAPPAGGTAGAAPAGSLPVPSLVLEGTDENFAQVLELSRVVPVVIDLWAPWAEPSKELSPLLERLVTEYAGRLLLVTVEVEANPQLTQAFQAQSVPTVAAVIGGRPLALFAGPVAEDQLRDVFDQLLALAAQNGVTGVAAV